MVAIWPGRAEQEPGVELHMQPVYIKDTVNPLESQFENQPLKCIFY